MEYRTNIDKFILIGAGKTTDYLNAYMKKLGKTFKDAFLLCLDNNSSLWETELDGVVIKPVEEIQKYPDTDVVISSIYEKEIRKQLKKLNISNPIINYIDYQRMLFVDFQVKKYNAVHTDIKNERNELIRELTVYTVIIGGYDLLREVIAPSPDVKYKCFTDDRTLRSDTWEIIYVDREFEDPILESRKYKMLPHRFIDTEYSLYIDATIQFKKSPLAFINQYFDKGNMLFLPHEERDCIYQEMATCIIAEKDSAQQLLNQAYRYSECNCPEHSGLFLGGMIGRNHFQKEVIEFDNKWWKHFQQYSRRDQISLAYLIWKNNIEISLANINIRNNSWFDINKTHKNEKL